MPAHVGRCTDHRTAADVRARTDHCTLTEDTGIANRGPPADAAMRPQRAIILQGNVMSNHAEVVYVARGTHSDTSHEVRMREDCAAWAQSCGRGHERGTTDECREPAAEIRDP